MPKKIILLLVGFIYMVVIVIGSTFFVADSFDFAADTLIKNKEVHKGLGFSEIATDLNPFEPSYLKTRAHLLLYASALDREMSAVYKNSAVDSLELAIELNPSNLATLRNTLPVYFYLAVTDLTQPITAKNLDYRYLDLFAKKSGILTSYVPDDLGVLVTTANYYSRLGMTDSYNEVITKIKHLRPDVLDWHPLLVR